jgi:CubicO group peptidase (beta-lactamase class C family)
MAAVQVPFGGRIDPGFAAVGDAFRANFVPSGERPPDLGAALCVVVDGVVVVDCWGGWCDPAMRRPWARDTLVNAYSVLKPVAAVLALLLVEAGELDLDGPVAAVWPEFAQAGKAQITLRDVLAHRAGLPGVRAVLPDGAMLNWDTMCEGLAASRPWWEPERGHGYHVNTFGFLAGEPVRRHTGSAFGAALRARMTGPLDLDLHVGLDAADLARVADIDAPHRVSEQPHTPVVLTGDEREQMLLHTYFNPPGLSGVGIVNTAAWRRSAIPSTNGHATARAVTAFYASLLAGAPHAILGPSLVTEATTPHSEGHDLVLDRPTRFGLGFALHQDERPVGTTPAAFGHYGYGGSLGFADPDANIAFAYLINRPGDRWQNPHTKGLLDAARSCL